MRHHLAKLVLTTLVGGCSLIYSKGNIPQRMPDAMADAEPIDADPSMLTLTDVAPMKIFEGQGDGGSRPAVLVIHGTNFVAGAQVTITGATSVTVDTTSPPVISSDSDYLAVPVIAHVDPTAGASATAALVVMVTQPIGGGATATKMIAGPTLQGQDELTSLASWQMGKTYSQIMLTGTTTITPGSMSGPLTLRAWSTVTTGDIVAKGGNASTTNGGAAGPGGCAGAAAQVDGTCAGGGKHGTNGVNTLGDQGGDGGGAGFAMMGASGTGGNGPGVGGAVVGDDQVSTFAANQAAGGGGGGKNSGLLGGANGGGGGGGGGTIELTAGGDLSCGNIDVTGGVGANASGGGGGGGAGGAVLLRAGHTLAAGTVTAVGGGGGTGGGGTGGNGSDGRIRWDNAAGTMPNAMPAAVEGPAFATATAPIVKTTSFSLVGTPNKTFNVYAVDATNATHAGQQGASFNGSGMATIDAPLSAGWNHLCVVVAPNGVQGTSTSEECVDVAYLP